jgi:hypothetical protein
LTAPYTKAVTQYQTRLLANTAELTAEELSMYDLIMGAQVTGNYDIMQKGLTWFRRENPSAYMTLLD